jgi:hypothetical protein
MFDVFGMDGFCGMMVGGATTSRKFFKMERNMESRVDVQMAGFGGETSAVWTVVIFPRVWWRW